MIEQLSSLGVLVAVLLLLVSIPFDKHEAGKALRKAAGVSFGMAIILPVLACLVAPLFSRGRSPVAMIEVALAGMGVLAILAVLSLAAYGLLDLRNRSQSRQPSAHGESAGYVKRRPAPVTDDDDAGDDAE